MIDLVQEVQIHQSVSTDQVPDPVWQQFLFVKGRYGQCDCRPTNKNMIGMIYATDALLEQAVYLLDYAERNWSDVKGTFVESLGR